MSALLTPDTPSPEDGSSSAHVPDALVPHMEPGIHDASVSDIVAFGDWHANERWARYVLTQVWDRWHPDAYLHVGDFGLWADARGKRFLNAVEAVLASQGRELWFIDGNHEDYRYLSVLSKDNRGLGQVRPHIFHIPRGFRFSWGGVSLVGLGGAYSIDRKYRTEGENWFVAEETTDEDVARTVAGGPADVLITHEAPFLPVGSSNSGIHVDEADQYASQRVRNRIQDAIAALHPSLLICGHHHVRYTRHEDGTIIEGLGMDGGYLTDNALPISLPMLKIVHDMT